MADPNFPTFDPSQLQEATYLNQGNQWNFGATGSVINKQNSAFQQTFQNLMGRPPTDDETNNFFQQQYVGQAHPDLLDPYQQAQSYVSNAFGPDIAKYNQQQQTAQLGTDQKMIQDMVNQSMTNTAGALKDPNSQTYQTLAGGMNNMGITPSSGAFQAGAGSTIANAGLQAANAGLTDIGIPGIQGISQTGNNPYNMAMSGGLMGQQQIQGLNNFELQAQLAQILAAQGNPSGAQNILGMASGAAGGAGGLLQGGSSAYKATSYVCMELIRRGLLCQMDMDDFHVHIMPAMFKKGRAFWKYAMDGWRLVNAVNAKGLDWKAFKPLLFDRVMDEPDACKAVDLYADACHQLCIRADPELWDERVFRNSVWDSLLFLPRLLTYRPFMEALAKCIRIKTMILYDKPTCIEHR